MSNPFFSLAIGIGSKNNKGEWLEVYYPNPLFDPSPDLVSQLGDAVGYTGGNQAIELNQQQINDLRDAIADTSFHEQAEIMNTLVQSSQPVVATFLATDSAPASTPEAYLKLHLISHRYVKPHGTDLSGIFPLLPNVAWTNQGAVDLEELPQRQLQARANGELLEVSSVDKFPKMTNYVVPNGVRIAHTARVRLGAYIGEGTTIMHEGFVNFNAGTEGTSMIEGRISAGVIVGKGSDLGGGCSTMGTLSGGNDVVISVGEGCLLGANAGLGIPLGDRCTVEAGLYVTGGSKVNLLDDKGQVVETVKAASLAGKSDLLFRRNSLSGALECKTNRSAIELNEELHAHN
ncbi:2,3,4,5-tetrahydropyridine-2,6-dicarboxylate N-succinyltransferase [Aestuariirhabdus sp. Z084]|uniref:2,3,4,5-tetrahydropyridine-2,6-dicarboxylate N-succinyltransferase n=1 Tax=Aestuariirhabdus haliotis TaxID=2918751 RepID=UPI00201B3E31|nr:2,3,4,5-tetrahydropyridine-2,6-dicarboxylate N-succinyltransferase [Aestuariirhabdus haliotis]MCL6416390.1 2,3,4,5-tetrahydropyridine-2,6-dicarboxylate N-succinyltransferase [Aestuariirhabdus haliotis]MCL6420379.1 2,3,4,5-tetrahydropyridine-2,6-dicarboxylate N-succinyltransferase [Aestuariirhabdus haliotis]